MTKKRKKKRGAGVKAPLNPNRDKMLRSPYDGGTTAVKSCLEGDRNRINMEANNA